MIIILFSSSNGIKIDNFKNIFDYKNKYFNFINLKDEFYLDTEYLEFYKKLQMITKNDNCIQNLNYDPTIYYLLKNPVALNFTQFS